MAWTAPRTWATGESLTAALLNEQLRDNLLVIGHSRSASLPGSPVDGQFHVYVADATLGVEWLLKFNSGEAGTYKWRALGPAPLLSEVAATQNTAVGAIYEALATAGPSAVLPLGGDYEVGIGYLAGSQATRRLMSYDIGGTGAVDADSAEGSAAEMVARTMPKAGLAAVTLTAKYKCLDLAVGGFGKRWMRVVPVRVA